MNGDPSSREPQTIPPTNQDAEYHLKNAISPHQPLLLVDGPSWVGHEIKHNDQINLIIIDGTLIPCRSRVEYETLMRLLQDPMVCVFFSDLMPSFEYQRDRDALGKRIQKIRHNLPASLTIRCEIGEGYVLREKSQKKEQKS